MRGYLKPEIAFNIDLAYEQRIEDFIKVEFTFFYTYLKDVMVRRDFTFNGQDSILYDGEMSKVQAIVNANSANIYGLNAGLYVNLSSHFSLKSHLTLMDGEDSDGYSIRHVPPTFHITHLIYTTEKLKVDFYIDYNGEISANKLALS